MKIFSAAQIKKWDEYTIAHEPILSIDLMEKAAMACCKWLIGKNRGLMPIRIFCGKGNNGGDGLALARILLQHQCRVTVYILEFGNPGTNDFQANLEKLHPFSTDIHFIQSQEFFPPIENTDLVIDALFGTGLNKPLNGISAALVNHINQYAATVISIDLPSGMFADNSSKGNTLIKATHTLSFQNHKLAFLLPENEMYCGELHLLPIGLHPAFEASEQAAFELTEKETVRSFFRPRNRFAHKGNFGHAALVAGSYGMMGAAVLAARACIRGGAGKLTCYIPECGYPILQGTVPEAMCLVSGTKNILPLGERPVPDPGIFDAMGAGPGIGRYPTHVDLLKNLFAKITKPMVLDADALNTIAEHTELLDQVPPYSILTPHGKEFERLFGPVKNDFERLQLALHHSGKRNIYILVKGHYSFISTPEGRGYFNSTGNPGMATAGSGDVLSGLLTSLLAQGYTPLQAGILGAYLHGLAGDLAAEKFSQEAMTAGDIIECLPGAFKQLTN